MTDLDRLIQGYDVRETLLEGKQVGTIYHFTYLNKFLSILKSNNFEGGYEFNNYYVSFTRDKNLWDKGGFGHGDPIVITMDGDKLSNNYEIHPISYWGTSAKRMKDYDFKSSARTNDVANESEERLLLRPRKPNAKGSKFYIDNAISYMKEVRILKRRFYREADSASKALQVSITTNLGMCDVIKAGIVEKYTPGDYFIPPIIDKWKNKDGFLYKVRDRKIDSIEDLTIDHIFHGIIKMVETKYKIKLVVVE